MKRALILSLSSGDNYNMVARAIVNGIVERYPSVSYRSLDVSHGGMHIGDEYTVSHRLANKIEKYREAKTNRDTSADKLRKIVSGYTKGITEYISETIKSYEPDMVVCTHIFPSIVINDLVVAGSTCMKGVKTAYVECNYVANPLLKLANNLDYYLCPTDDVAKSLRRYSINKRAIVQSFGLPILSKIENITDSKEAKDLLGYPSGNKVIIVDSCGNKHTRAYEVVRELAKTVYDATIVAICNKDAKLRARLDMLSKQYKNIKVYGQANNMGLKLSASDVIITYTGGVAIARAIAKGVPVIAMPDTVGTEMDNLEWLEAKGAVLRSKSVSDVIQLTKKILTNTALVKRCKTHMEKLYKHNSTDEVVKFLYHNHEK
ncbi:MAG: hypothetical protein E7361_02180 [Clostridiales bacterium]|nr:hypothetical protein [Clostridiales bacterium]